MTSFDLVLRGGAAILPGHGRAACDIAVRDGRIAAIVAPRWSKREKQIQRVICNTSGMYGDLQGLIGSSLHNIPALSHQDHDLGEAA